MGNMENSVKPHENKMGTMPMTRLILTMSLPAIFSMTIQAMYNVVDSIFIGNYDADGLTATSLAYPLQMLLIAFAAGTAVGVNSFVSRKLGEKNFVQANDGATHGLVTCIFNYVIFLLLGLFAVRPFMAMYTQNEAIVNYGIQYLTVVLCFSFFSIVQIMVEKTLQATGNMIFPMFHIEIYLCCRLSVCNYAVNRFRYDYRTQCNSCCFGGCRYCSRYIL